MADLRSEINALLRDAVESGGELGCQCAVWRDGMQIIDFSGGWCESSKLRPVTPSSLFPVFSAGKAVLGVAALQAVAHGMLSLHTPLCTLWRELSGERRDSITLAHVLSHTTGLFCLPHADTPEELANWQLMTSRLAAMRPAWQPGQRTRYQALTYSWLAGEPLALASGMSLSDVLNRLVIVPAGMTGEFFSGIPAGEEHRLVRLERAGDLQPPLPARQTFWNPTENMLRASCIRRAVLPAFNSMSSANGLMRLGASLLSGLLPDELLAEATRLQRPAHEPIPAKPGYWEIFGYGLQLFGGEENRGALYGHGGYGGAELLVHPESRTVFAFTRNRLAEDKSLPNAIKAILGF